MDLLSEIKKRLSITGNYQDDLLLGLAHDTKNYLISAGVKESVVNSEISIGCIARGVFDLWTKDSFSELFNQRLIQLKFEPETDLEIIPDTEIKEGDVENVLSDETNL